MAMGRSEGKPLSKHSRQADHGLGVLRDLSRAQMQPELSRSIRESGKDAAPTPAALTAQRDPSQSETSQDLTLQAGKISCGLR